MTNSIADTIATVFFVFVVAFFAAPFCAIPFTIAAYLMGMDVGPGYLFALGFIMGLRIAGPIVLEIMD